MKHFLIPTLFLSILLSHCRMENGRITARQNTVFEYSVLQIPLKGDITDPAAEISGLTWYGEYLILLPQYPGFSSTRGGGRIFALRKEEIRSHLVNGEGEALHPLSIPVVAPDFTSRLDGFEGYEAIVFDGDKAFLTIEVEGDPPSDTVKSYLVTATLASDLSMLRIDTTLIGPFVSPSGVENMGDETLVRAASQILSIHEANGVHVNETPRAHIFDVDTGNVRSIPFATIPYRITDATGLDENNRFWVINYYFPGEKELLSRTDPLSDRFGEGPSHTQSDVVERLVELQYDEAGIALTGTPPIQLQLLPAGKSRNWEGIVRFDDTGFLIVTDEFPNTELAFVQRQFLGQNTGL